MEQLINPNATVADELKRLSELELSLRQQNKDCYCVDPLGNICDKCIAYEHIAWAIYRLKEIMEIYVSI